MKTRTFLKITAKNRFGHETVYAANNIIDLIVCCFRAVVYYRWINLNITRVVESWFDEPWMQLLHEHKTPVIRNEAKEKFRVYVSITEDDANRFAEFVGAQSVVSRSDGAFDILVLSTGSYN